MANTTLTAKLPDEVIYIDFDFTNVFASTVTISEATFSISTNSGTDSSPDDMVSGTPTVSGSVVSQLLEGGIVGATYLLEMLATGSDGTKQAIQLLLPVKSVRLG